MSQVAVAKYVQPMSLRELLSLSAAQLAADDIGRANLLCAEGLPDAEDLDVSRYLAVINLWAKRIQALTNKHFAVFRGNPGKYDNSEGFWRMLGLTTTLRDEFNVRYNMERIEREDWSHSCDTLIHGILGPRRAGTCASLPVLVVAIGRQLGYPLHLVHTLGHQFVRWEDVHGKDRFNIEFNGDGMSRHSDQYYREWPVKWTAEILALEAQRGDNRAFLRNLSPGEEVAHAFCMRGHCLEAAGRWEEGLEAYAVAIRFAPSHPAYPVYANELQTKMRSADDLMAQVIEKTPNFDPQLPALIRVDTVPIANGFTIALAYKQLPHPVAPFDEAVTESGSRTTLLSIRRIVNQVHAKHHPLDGLKPGISSDNLGKGTRNGCDL